MDYQKLIGGILLVAGTTIGAAMLALPISTGMAGFLPSVLLFVFYWMFMGYTAFLFLEATGWVEKDANLITMARKTLGIGGEIVSWIFYLFLLYALTTAYIAGSSPIVHELLQSLTGLSLPMWMGALPLLIIFGIVVYRGTRSVDRLNRILMGGLVVSYFLLVIFLVPYFDVKNLVRAEWSQMGLAVSVIATSYGFHIIIPSLSTYFNKDIHLMKKAILIGSVIPLVVYTLWNTLALGILPLEGEHGIVQGYIQGHSGAHLISKYLQSDIIVAIARVFSFFAIVTSFLGVSLALSDFLADGFKIKKTPSGKIFIYILTFIPPLILTLTDPRIFLTALEYAGAFGVVVLLGFLPAAMVWSGRYWRRLPSTYTAPGGKPALLLVMAISVIIIGLEIFNQVR